MPNDPLDQTALDIVERLRVHVQIRGGPAKDDDGNFVASVWPMMLEAADEIERLRAYLAALSLGAKRG